MTTTYLSRARSLGMAAYVSGATETPHMCRGLASLMRESGRGGWLIPVEMIKAWCEGWRHMHGIAKSMEGTTS